MLPPEGKVPEESSCCITWPLLVVPERRRLDLGKERKKRCRWVMEKDEQNSRMRKGERGMRGKG